MSKYNNKKQIIDGIRFDSKKEATRWEQLKCLEKMGKIEKLSRQVEYELIPTQYTQVTNPRNGRLKNKCIERKCKYVADFVYFQDGKWVVEDVKGKRTKDYVLKRKLMLYLKGIRIKET